MGSTAGTSPFRSLSRAALVVMCAASLGACTWGRPPGTTTTTRSTATTGPVPTALPSSTWRPTSTSATTTPVTVPTTSRPTTSTTAPTGSGCAGALLCDGFESQSGTGLSGIWSVAKNPCDPPQQNPPSTASRISIDHGKAHSGSASVKISGGVGYCNSAFATPAVNVAGMGTNRYLRFWVNHDTALPPDHVTFLAMQDQGKKDLRMGGQNQALQFNREENDATLPDQSPTGVSQSKPLPTNTWSCIQVHIDSGNGYLETSLNGVPVPGLTAAGTVNPSVNEAWVRGNWRPLLADLRLGWQSYGGGADTLRFDDVALSTRPIGC